MFMLKSLILKNSGSSFDLLTFSFYFVKEDFEFKYQRNSFEYKR